MAYQKRTWKDRLSEFPGRRLLTIVSNSGNQMVVDVARHEGEVPQEGDAFNQANMNDLEQRIGDEFDVLNNNLNRLFPDYTAPLYSITKSNVSYIAPSNCIIIGTMQTGTSGNAAANILIDNVVVVSVAESNVAYRTLCPVFVPVKSGSVISTDKYGIYNLKIYEV